MRDNLNILSHFNFFRLWNLAVLYLSFWVSRIVKRSIIWGKPFSLSIEPTTACNLGCPECPSGLKQFTRPTGKLDLAFHDKMLDQVAGSVFYINYYFQGEPFLHPQFLSLIRATKTKKIYTSTSTNAHFITKEKAEEIVASGLDRLIISIDGLTQATYEQYRVHGKLDKVIAASKLLVEAKQKAQSPTPHLIFQFLAVQPNEHEIPAVFELGKEIGIDEVRIKTAQLYDFENGHPLLPKNEKYARYKLGKDGKYHIKGNPGNHCWRMWSGSVLTWDGKVVPCCFDKDAKHVLGDLKEKDFAEIWKSERYKNFRFGVLNHRNKIDICNNCTEGTKVWA